MSVCLLLEGKGIRVDELHKQEVQNSWEQYSVHSSSAGDKLLVLMSVLAVVTCDKWRFLLPSDCYTKSLSALAAILQKDLGIFCSSI